MFPDEYCDGHTIVEYLVDFFKPDLEYMLDVNDPDLTNRIFEANRMFLLSMHGGTPPHFRTLCASKSLPYEEVVEIILREAFSEPNDVYWWLR